MNTVIGVIGLNGCTDSKESTKKYYENFFGFRINKWFLGRRRSYSPQFMLSPIESNLDRIITIYSKLYPPKPKHRPERSLSAIAYTFQVFLL